MSTPQANKLTATERILSEDPIPLSEARAELTPILKKRIEQSTIVRWCNRGVRGVKLEHVKIGNMIVTSRPAISRFIAARSATKASQ